MCIAYNRQENELFPAPLIRPSGRVVVQCDVPGDIFFMIVLDVGDEAIAWRLGVME